MLPRPVRTLGLLVVAASLLVSAPLPAVAATGGTPAAPPAPALTLESPSAVLMEATSGQVLFEKDAHERRPPASVTKVMTLLLAFEAIEQGRIKLTDEVVASPEAASLGGTQIWLEPGERMKVSDLLQAVAVASANDASQALGEFVGGSAEGFVDLMNRRAQELGMNDTHFANPHGLDQEGHYTSAYDLALLSRAAVRYPELLKLTAVYDTTVNLGNRSKPVRLTNRNRLVRFYDGADGLKTGMTDTAKYCIVATARRGASRFIAVIMAAPTPTVRQNEVTKLLNLGFATYASVPLVRTGEPVGQPVRVVRGTRDRVVATVPQDFGVAVRKGQEKKVKTQTVLPPSVQAPLAKGDRVGELVVTLDGKELARTPLVAAEGIPRATLLRTFWMTFTRLIRM
ncbi:MAG: D-alanyl-D-alanine carboxypeptidase family protein [Bacillota bacterium]